MDLLRESEWQAFGVGTLAPLRYRVFDQVPDGRDADFPPGAITSARQLGPCADLKTRRHQW